MRDQKLFKYKRRLLNEREKIAAEVGFIHRQGMEMPLSSSISELSTYDNHPADIGSEVFERGKDFALRDTGELILAAIDAALEKIENGNYGICTMCGKEISPARLEAVPFAAECLECKEAAEDAPRRHDRPVEEEVLGRPFARTFHDAPGDIMYDGEDAWQEVARYSETTDEWSRGGSYYGYSEFDQVEDPGAVEEVDNIPYEVGADGVIYKNFRGKDDERAPS